MTTLPDYRHMVLILSILVLLLWDRWHASIFSILFSGPVLLATKDSWLLTLSSFLSAHPLSLQPWLNRTHARIIKLIKIPFKGTHGHGQYFILSQTKTVRQLQVYQIMHTVPFDRLPTCSISHGDGWQFQNGWTQKAIDIHWLFNLTNQPTSRELNAKKQKALYK